MDYSDLKIDQKNNEPDISDSENISFQLSLDDTPDFCLLYTSDAA